MMCEANCTVKATRKGGTGRRRDGREGTKSDCTKEGGRSKKEPVAIKVRLSG